MNLRPQITTVLAACLGLTMAIGSTALAQSSLDRAVLGTTTPLTEAQKAAVEAYISKSVDAIKDGPNAAAIEEARAALISAARDPASSPTFRKAYAVALIAELGPVVKGGDLRRSINAMQVLRFTRTTEGVDMIVERALPASETDAGKRIAAAGLVADAFEDLDSNNTYFETVARRLKDGVAAETDVLALQQKLVAITAAAHRKDLPAENARAVRKSMVEAIALVSKSIRQSTTPDARIQALQRALVTVRNDLLAMSQAERSAMAKQLALALADLVAGASAQWGPAHQDPMTSASYASVMNNCEVLLRLIDRGERPQAYAGSKPEGDQRVLGPCWESNDKAKFDAESKRWADVLGAAPYKS